MSPLPNWMSNDRRVTRSVPNPMDKSTIASIFPMVIVEIKHTIEPGKFRIEAGSYEKPAILVVGTSSWWKETDPEQPLLQIPENSVIVADSIIKDYCNGLLACNMGTAMPGLFFVPGELTVEQLKKEHKARFDAALLKQKNWYAELVKMADVLWARSNGNPLSISDVMRLAAQELQLKDKPWLKDFTTLQLSNCPACGSLYDAHYPVCKSCNTIVNKKLFESLNLQTA